MQMNPTAAHSSSGMATLCLFKRAFCSVYGVNSIQIYKRINKTRAKIR